MRPCWLVVQKRPERGTPHVLRRLPLLYRHSADLMCGGLLYWMLNQALHQPRHSSLFKSHQLHLTSLPRLSRPSHPQKSSQLLASLLRPSRAFRQAFLLCRLRDQKLNEVWTVPSMEKRPVKRPVGEHLLLRAWNRHLSHLLLLQYRIVMHWCRTMQLSRSQPPSSCVRLQVHLLLYLLLRHHRLRRQRHWA
jgi:hypothetical protein